MSNNTLVLTIDEMDAFAQDTENSDHLTLAKSVESNETGESPISFEDSTSVVTIKGSITVSF